MHKNQQLIFHLRMQLAALKQYLRDNSDNMTEEKKDDVLDRIGTLIRVIEDLEKRM